MSLRHDSVKRAEARCKRAHFDGKAEILRLILRRNSETEMNRGVVAQRQTKIERLEAVMRCPTKPG